MKFSTNDFLFFHLWQRIREFRAFSHDPFFCIFYLVPKTQHRKHWTHSASHTSFLSLLSVNNNTVLLDILKQKHQPITIPLNPHIQSVIVFVFHYWTLGYSRYSLLLGYRIWDYNITGAEEPWTKRTIKRRKTPEWFISKAYEHLQAGSGQLNESPV